MNNILLYGFELNYWSFCNLITLVELSIITASKWTDKLFHRVLLTHKNDTDNQSTDFKGTFSISWDIEEKTSAIPRRRSTFII